MYHHLVSCVEYIPLVCAYDSLRQGDDTSVLHASVSSPCLRESHTHTKGTVYTYETKWWYKEIYTNMTYPVIWHIQWHIQWHHCQTPSLDMSLSLSLDMSLITDHWLLDKSYEYIILCIITWFHMYKLSLWCECLTPSGREGRPCHFAAWSPLPAFGSHTLTPQVQFIYRRPREDTQNILYQHRQTVSQNY